MLKHKRHLCSHLGLDCKNQVFMEIPCRSRVCTCGISVTHSGVGTWESRKRVLFLALTLTSG